MSMGDLYKRVTNSQKFVGRLCVQIALLSLACFKVFFYSSICRKRFFCPFCSRNKVSDFFERVIFQNVLFSIFFLQNSFGVTALYSPSFFLICRWI